MKRTRPVMATTYKESRAKILLKNTCWGSIAQWLAYFTPNPSAPGLIPSVPDKDLAGVIQCRLEESGQWLESVD